MANFGTIEWIRNLIQCRIMCGQIVHDEHGRRLEQNTPYSSPEYISKKSHFLNRLNTGEKIIIKYFIHGIADCQGRGMIRENEYFLITNKASMFRLLTTGIDGSNNIETYYFDFDIPKYCINLINLNFYSDIQLHSMGSYDYGKKLTKNIIDILSFIKTDSTGIINNIFETNIKNMDNLDKTYQYLLESKEKLDNERKLFESDIKPYFDLIKDKKDIQKRKEDLDQKEKKILLLSRKVKMEKENLELEKQKLKELSLSDLEDI